MTDEGYRIDLTNDDFSVHFTECNDMMDKIIDEEIDASTVRPEGEEICNVELVEQTQISFCHNYFPFLILMGNQYQPSSIWWEVR